LRPASEKTDSRSASGVRDRSDALSTCPYGSFDQGGNVFELTETVIK
jgi:hypothetical protein